MLNKLTIAFYIFVAGWAFGDATYFDQDGYGFYVPIIGGYHVSLLEGDY